MIMNDAVYNSFLHKVCLNCNCYEKCKKQDFSPISDCIDENEKNNMELFNEKRDL